MDLVWVTKAKYISDYKIELAFNNGIKGQIDLEDNLTLHIYEPLKDKEYFRNFRLNSWTIEWKNGADFAPEFLFNLLIKQKHTQTDNNLV
jgi:hypothetical protein